MNDNIPTEVEEQFREIAREEAKDVYDIQVEDGDGSSWSLSSIMQRFEVDRRTALKALGLVAIGYTAPIAVLKAVSGTAQAAATDDLTVPGTLDAGTVSTDSGVIDGSKDIPGVPSSSSNPVLSFDSWRQAASSRPAMIFVQTGCVTDGSTDARITLSVDESGGTAPDYFPNIARAPSELGDGGRMDDLTAYMLPAGAQYRVDNTGDPRGQNTLDQVFEFVL